MKYHAKPFPIRSINMPALWSPHVNMRRGEISEIANEGFRQVQSHEEAYRYCHFGLEHSDPFIWNANRLTINKRSH